MRMAGLVEVAEVDAVVRQDRPPSARQCQNALVGNGEPGVASLASGQDVMVGWEEGSDDVGEILVGVKPGQRDSPLVLGNLSLDLIGVRIDVGPGVDQVGGSHG